VELDGQSAHLVESDSRTLHDAPHDRTMMYLDPTQQIDRIRDTTMARPLSNPHRIDYTREIREIRDTRLDDDIARISEKIDTMGISRAEPRLAAQREMEIRRENEKVMQADKRLDSTYRLTESDYSRPAVPHRSPLRSPPGSSPQTPDWTGSPDVVGVGILPSEGYSVAASPQVFSVQEEGGFYGEEKDGWRMS
jgi:hypothetical protein